MKRFLRDYWFGSHGLLTTAVSFFLTIGLTAWYIGLAYGADISWWRPVVVFLVAGIVVELVVGLLLWDRDRRRLRRS